MALQSLEYSVFTIPTKVSRNKSSISALATPVQKSFVRRIFLFPVKN